MSVTEVKRVNVSLSPQEYKYIELYAEHKGKTVTSALKDLALMNSEQYEDYQFSNRALENMKNTTELVPLDEW